MGRLSERTLAIIRQHVSDILTVSDEEIIAAMRLVWERMKIIIEPSCAVPLAVVLKHPDQFAGQKVGIILTALFEIGFGFLIMRIGKAALHDLLDTWLRRLRADGSASLVVQKHLGADSLQRWLIDAGHSCERVGSKAGFRLLTLRPGGAT